MKKLLKITIYTLFLCVITFNTYSQVDAKYLAGAVPEINGKVIFSDTLHFEGKSSSQIYELSMEWAKANFATEDNRVVYSDKENAVISCRGKADLIFSSSMISLDKTSMNFQLNLFCHNNICRIEMKSISYEYNVSNKREPEKYFAEKWITDKEAMNGKNKFYRNNGKFRIKTIDLFDDICNSVNLNILTGDTDLYTDKNKTKFYDRKNTKEITQTIQVKNEPEIIEQRPPKNNTLIEVKPIQQTPERNTTVKSTETTSMPQGYRKLDPKQIPGNIIKMLSEDWMLITAGNDSNFNMMTASWGGLGMVYGKPVSFTFINPTRHTYQLMESGDTYTLSFYTEAYREALKYCGSASGKNADKIKGSGLTPITMPSGAKSFSEAWLIIECKKFVAQQIQWESVKDEKIREDWSKSQFHKMYIGEIINVWVK